jgi:inner membrane protein
MATLMIASNLPDVDVAVFATDTLAMSFRRGWTHGLPAQLLLPLLLAAVMFALARGRARQSRVNHARSHAADPNRARAPALDADRRRGGSSDPPADFGALLLLSYVGVIAHVLMDWLNSYGVRLLKPFSDRWFYGDALYIIDPVLYVVFGAGIALARWRGRRAGDATMPGRVGLAIAGTYMALMLVSNWWARAEVRTGLQRAGRIDARFMVTPVFANPFRREVLIDVGDRYEKGVLWFDPTPHFRPAGYGVDKNMTDPAVVEAMRMPRVQAFLLWSRFPFFVVERTANRTVVVVNDYRYSGPGGRDGWATQVVEVR